MTGREVLTNISEAIKEGVTILTKMKDLLSNEKERHSYPITIIQPPKDEGRIDFNFYWVKLFLKFQLRGKYGKSHVYGNEEFIRFGYPLIWGRYILRNGIETEKPIVKESRIRESPGGIGLELVYGELFYSLDEIKKCLLIIDQIIYKCLPESMVKIENLDLM